MIGAERIETRTVIWAAGVAASPAARWLGAEKDRVGRVAVAELANKALAADFRNIDPRQARIILAEAVVHLATAPKSNRAYLALDAAIADVRAGKLAPVPLQLRNDDFRGAKDLGYKEGYKYAHDFPEGVATMEFMPEGLEGTHYYEPTGRGFEAKITPRLAHVRSLLQGEADSLG